MQIGVITLFPEMFDALKSGVVGRALEQKKVEFAFWNPRDYSEDSYHTVDDNSYGGGPGMVMKARPIIDAIEAAKKILGQPTKVIYVTPQGKLFNQQAAIQLAKEEKVIFLSGRYEGVDERVMESEVDEEWSVGDYVLSGGELAVMAMCDAAIRLLPGVLGNEASADQDSFVHGLLDYPHYTRPDKIRDLNVPEVLLSGDHAAIARWRLKQSLGRTWLRRPDLLAKRMLTPEEQILLTEFIEEHQRKVYEESDHCCD